jgi:hypothetical protein
VGFKGFLGFKFNKIRGLCACAPAFFSPQHPVDGRLRGGKKSDLYKKGASFEGLRQKHLTMD